MKIYDISLEINEDMAVYKNKKDKKPKIIVTRKLKDGANESKLIIESHTGTHADAFFHMLSKGKTMEKISINKFVGSCVVIDFTKIKNKITIKNFQKKKIIKNDIVLLKTRKILLKKFDKNYTYLDKTGAKFLAGKKIKCVGVDNLGIATNSPFLISKFNPLRAFTLTSPIW